ncbi:hypothetical protein N1078_10240 [Pseudomonas sp. MIL19]|uniref:hypothetical protein n=1 Tax=Pseudomonas sp. MIL19 TaxID=2976979 RepID=UPI0023637859|nr:hypothetical protein [Pseudomonas sp. MIL19]MDD2160956.1 hypothetical protein [Pseudomonas sp. MIL19]
MQLMLALLLLAKLSIVAQLLVPKLMAMAKAVMRNAGEHRVCKAMNNRDAPEACGHFRAGTLSAGAKCSSVKPWSFVRNLASGANFITVMMAIQWRQ